MKLFEPFQLKGLLLKNRVVMASMGTNLASPEGFVTDEMISYYAERAKGGAGLIITELVTIDSPLGNGIERQLSIDEDKYIFGLRKLTTEIHRHGSKIFIQLNHAGNRAKLEFKGMPFIVSASNIPSSIMKVKPKPLTLEEIAKLIDSFGRGARRAREAGFDGIDLHIAHGYLLCQFLSNLTNKRLDDYGGNLENRARFALEVLKQCRSEVGEDFLISGKITGNQYVNGGITLREARAFCSLLEEKGIDAIQVSGGDSESSDHFPVPPMYSRQGCYLSIAESIKKALGVPVIAVGRINNIELANRIVESGKVDLVAMGRAFLADPYFLRKAQTGKYEEIRTCIGCNQGCIGRDRKKYLTVGCVLNPLVGREKEKMEIAPAKFPKKVLVVGAGPGGLEAARVAGLRGHDVILVEKQKGLGGQLLLAGRPPGRGEFHHLIHWYRVQLSKLGVKIRLGCKATPDLIRSLTPDTVIFATGSRPLILKIEGLRPTKNVTAFEILGKKTIQTGQRVVIIGGGGVGLETADFLATRGKKVTIIEKLLEVGRDLEPFTKKVLMGRLLKHRVKILTGVIIDRVKGGKVFVKLNGGKKEIAFDGFLINAIGVEANRELSLSLKGNKEFEDFEIYEIGDCVSPRQLRDAIFEGYMISQNI